MHVCIPLFGADFADTCVCGCVCVCRVINTGEELRAALREAVAMERIILNDLGFSLQVFSRAMYA